MESRPVITSIQLVVSGAQNGKREGESEQAAHLLPGASWQPVASQAEKGQGPEKAGSTESRGVRAHKKERQGVGRPQEYRLARKEELSL